MFSNHVIRYLSTSNIIWQSTNKSLLGKLRKKTGYTFANCKKALELHENNLEKAEAWLTEQAQAMGWSKAQKLQGRSTSQGLISVIVDKNHGTLVEVNCETDFVARNKEFHGLANVIASAVMTHSKNAGLNGYNKTLLDADSIKALQASDGKLIADHSALAIGTLGENIAVKRALCMTTQPDVILTGLTHPAPVDEGSIYHGKYGVLLAFKSQENQEVIGKQLCQHIIGLNPTKIGDPEVDKPSKIADEETALIHQDFLLDPDMKVHELLKETGTQVLDFVRFEVGEVVEGQQSLDAVETAG